MFDPLKISPAAQLNSAARFSPPVDAAVAGVSLLNIIRYALFHIVFALLGLGLVTSANSAPMPPVSGDIRGLWVNHALREKQKFAVWIDDCEGRLCGRIYWLKKPLAADGQPKQDAHNPDDTLRARSLCGLNILDGFHRVKQNSWAKGKLYNPLDGKTFDAAINLLQDGSISVRPYIGTPLFGKTLRWVRTQKTLPKCDSSS
ncbi:DUF2147 domain-containing protein [Ferrigenium sp. UT5]|uniref:DUF2147 domain-containing protein n=1 Tax=Ferrigenium sp. UT5 TaxID=3242105 RepID=UPI00354F337F